MGIHDYIDFIQRNGQNLICLELSPDDDCSSDLENDTAGANSAILVLIPIDYTRDDLLSWPLTRFAQFPSIKTEYSWDDWDFEPSLGYDEILRESDEWINSAIWQSPQYPNKWIVNFEPHSYNMFILGLDDPNLVPWSFYRMIFDNRSDSCPGSSLDPDDRHNCKMQAYNLILNYNNNPDCVNLGLPKACQKYHNTFSHSMNQHLNNPVFSQVYTYKYSRPLEVIQGRISHGRIQVLIEDNLKPLELLKPKVTKRFIKEDLINISFQSCSPIHLSSELEDGCIICQNIRSIGHYTCYDHLCQEDNNMIEYCDRINKQYMTLIHNMKVLQKATVPKQLTVRFTEKQIPIHITLELLGEPRDLIHGEPPGEPQ